jgi:hypothetical protein
LERPAAINIAKGMIAVLLAKKLMHIKIGIIMMLILQKN